MSDTAVIRDDDAARYEISVDGVLAGFAEFERRTGAIVFTHTEVLPAFQGKGLAGRLAADALADAAATGATIIPACPYIASYLRSHEVPGAIVRFPASEGAGE